MFANLVTETKSLRRTISTVVQAGGSDGSVHVLPNEGRNGSEKH